MKEDHVRLIYNAVNSSIHIPDLQECKEDVQRLKKDVFVLKATMYFQLLISLLMIMLVVLLSL
jgi:hypothetical protein